jgi:hypothetical protein
VPEKALHDSAPSTLSIALNMIDARPEKGMIKILFANHYRTMQQDAPTGWFLHVDRTSA